MNRHKLELFSAFLFIFLSFNSSSSSAGHLQEYVRSQGEEFEKMFVNNDHQALVRACMSRQLHLPYGITSRIALLADGNVEYIPTILQTYHAPRFGYTEYAINQIVEKALKDYAQESETDPLFLLEKLVRMTANPKEKGNWGLWLVAALEHQSAVNRLINLAKVSLAEELKIIEDAILLAPHLNIQNQQSIVSLLNSPKETERTTAINFLKSGFIRRRWHLAPSAISGLVSNLITNDPYSTLPSVFSNCLHLNEMRLAEIELLHVLSNSLLKEEKYDQRKLVLNTLVLMNAKDTGLRAPLEQLSGDSRLTEEEKKILQGATQ